MKKRASFAFILFLMALAVIAFITIEIQHEHLKVTERILPRAEFQNQFMASISSLPRGIVESTTDMQMKPLWDASNLKDSNVNFTGLLAIAVGIAQKRNVDSMVRKFLKNNCSVILFHYDGNVDGWNDLEWTDKAIHILARNQTKWWFAKRFLHPDVVALYDYIFLWDEDIGVDYFNPGRYMQIIFSEGLEISQPAVDPELSFDIHHRITVRNKKTRVHRRVYFCGSVNCSDESRGPPCTGWVEGMVPVFSRSAWRCAWHLIQLLSWMLLLHMQYANLKNDLIHGWGLDMKLGYCAQVKYFWFHIFEKDDHYTRTVLAESASSLHSEAGDRTKNVGVIDTEFIIHHGIPSLGGVRAEKAAAQKSLDSRTRIRRQSTAELEKFKKRWNRAAEEDRDWSDPFED